MSKKITATHERVDDIPVIIVQLKKMRVAELLDKHFPTNGNGSGLSLGGVAVGFEYRVEQSTQDQSGQTQRWQARRLVVRSLAFAESQEKSLRQRVARAVTESNALEERKKGKQRLPDEVAARQAAEAIIAQ
jgi:hypothetical protein